MWNYGAPVPWGDFGFRIWLDSHRGRVFDLQISDSTRSSTLTDPLPRDCAPQAREVKTIESRDKKPYLVRLE